MTRDRNYYMALSSVGALFICLLVCIGLIASSTFSKENVDSRLAVYEQNYRMDLANIDRNFEMKHNRMQEQMSSNEFVSRKRIELLEDDIRRNKLEIRTLHEEIRKLKAH